MHDSSAGVNRNLNEISEKEERKVSRNGLRIFEETFGTPKDGEAPKAMTYEELEAAIDADKKIQVVDIKSGGYVSKEKLDAKITELDGVKQQLAMPIQKSSPIRIWTLMVLSSLRKTGRPKYNEDTKKLNDQLAAQSRSHAEDMFLSGYKFTSKAARKGVLDELRSKQFQLDDNGTFLGQKSS